MKRNYISEHDPKSKTKIFKAYSGNSYHTEVCERCRISSRNGTYCSLCGEEMKSIGQYWRVPKKDDDNGWQTIWEKFYRARDRTGEGFYLLKKWAKK